MKTIYKVLLLLPFLASCVDLYDPALKSTVQRLVVEAQLTTRLEYQYVYLTFDSGYNGDETNFKFLVKRAKVNVTDDKGNTFNFFDEITQNNQIKTPEGYNYRSVDKFKVEVGKSYRVNIETFDGKKYQSDLELVKPVNKIEKVITEYKDNFPPQPFVGTFNVFIDAQDPVASKDYYMWRTAATRQIKYCREWYIFGRDGAVTQAFIDECCQVCYETEKCEECFEIANDKFINGKKIVRQFVTSVPFKDRTPFFLTISQYSLNENAYKYWFGLKEQGKNSGGLFDVTPKSVKGNIKSLSNPEEVVLGYFTVSDVQDFPVRIDRDRSSPKPNDYEEYSTFSKTATCFPCEEKYNRSKLPPKGW